MTIRDIINNGADTEQKIKALRELAKLETSANGRHYYLASAYEAEEKLK